MIEREGAKIGLHLNKVKSEIICASPEISDPIASCLPGAKIVDPSEAALLGSPIGRLVLSFRCHYNQGELADHEGDGERLQCHLALEILLLPPKAAVQSQDGTLFSPACL